MKKILSIILAFAMMCAMTACSASTPTTDKFGSALNGAGGAKGDGMSDVLGGIDGDYDLVAPEMAPGESGDIDVEEPVQQPNASAGTLTAGEWKDAENLEFWTKLLNRNDWYQLMEDRNLYTNKIVTVYVHDANGNPCYNVPVQLLTTRETVYNARTDVNGYAYICYNVNNTDEAAAFVIVSETSVEVKDDKADITAENVGMEVQALDLMLMVDTTGSMGDELNYLQKELENVIERVADAGKTISINVSVNFYRDENDDYVVNAFEFTSDITEAITQLNAQRSDGGGDYPEAVHKALDNAIKEHQWRDGAVKLMFFVLDAPPHSESEIKGINAQMTETVQKAAEKGIRIIPLASSGVNTETEFLLRSWALMTGGTYTFLTDHSGIGNDHLEPTIGEYEVEKLNECMIRVICEYCGLEYKTPSTNQQ